MAYTTINKSTLHCNQTLYTGNATTRTISGVNFQPGLAWLKDYDTVPPPVPAVFDSIRGATYSLNPGGTTANTQQLQELTAFNADGFDLGTSSIVNGNTVPNIAWCFKGGSSNVSNAHGSITSTVSADPTAGFSVVKYTGTGANATVGHGLSSAPEFILIKNFTSTSTQWSYYHVGIGPTKYFWFSDNPAAATSSAYWNNTAPTTAAADAGVFSLGSATEVNGSSDEHIAYCFSPVKGFSAAGIYNGTGIIDGPFVYTGFKPAMVMTKVVEYYGSSFLFDTKRAGYNVDNYLINWGAAAVQNSTGPDILDLVSNGFKIRTDASQGFNHASRTYCYYAWAAAPLVGTNDVPACAR
jgi:hypothetical protein